MDGQNMISGEKVKKVISVSLGSSRRNADGILYLGDTRVELERIGTDGDLSRAAELLRFYDGRVDAIGLGGTDLYLSAGGCRYIFSESAKLLKNSKRTPVVDGSGLKDTLERMLIRRLAEERILDFSGRRVLLTCAADRFGMAEALEEQNCRLTFGDLIFGLGINKPLHDTKTLTRLAAIIAPIITRLPIRWLYPTGKKQEEKKSFHPEYFLENEIIAGDFLLIKRFMPPRLTDKTILTNTVTAEDRQLLKEAGVKKLITTTPCINGRSFGTNVIEAALVAAAGSLGPLTPEEYEDYIHRYDLQFSVEDLQQGA